METENKNQSEFKKKKKKRSFLQQAKKFGKQGRFGKGQDIDANTYNYFVQVLSNLDKNDFEDEESREIFVANVFASNENQEEKLCCNQLASRVIEKLLPLAPKEVRLRLMGKLGVDLRRYASNPFASHILETLLVLSTFKQKTDDEDDKEFAEEKRQWSLKIAKYCINNFDEFASDLYASHIMRNIFQCLAGVRLSKELIKSKKSISQAQNNLNLVTTSTEISIFSKDDQEVDGVFKLAFKKIEDSESIQNLCSHQTASGVIQSLLLVLVQVDLKLCKKLTKLITNEIFADKDDSMFNNEPIARLLEVMIQVSGSDSSMEKIFKHFYTKIFKDDLANLSQHPSANFAVQKLLSSCPSKEIFEEMYENELDDKIGSILEAGKSSGVVLATAQACRRLGAKQAHFLVALMKALQCQDNQEKQAKFLVYLVRLLPASKYEDSAPVSLHGALLTQELLHFNKPIKLANSMIGCDASKLANILSDPRGSHITDAFMTSTSLGEKSRESLVKLLSDELVNMACSKHGSRSIDAIWSKASPKLRETVAAKLVNHETRLNGDQFGKFVSTNLGLSLFKRSREQWKASFDKKEKAKKLFSEFITKPPKAVIKVEFAEVKKEDVVDDHGGFLIDKSGDNDLLDEIEPKKNKKRQAETKTEEIIEKKSHKKKSKSYLDDL